MLFDSQQAQIILYKFPFGSESMGQKPPLLWKKLVKPIEPSQWLLKEDFEDNQLHQFGSYLVFQNIDNPAELINCHEVVFNSQEQYDFYEQSYLWRLDEHYISKSVYLSPPAPTKWCGSRFKASIYLQHPRNRLSDFKDIPFPDNLYCLSATLQGYYKLYQNIGATFPVYEQQICLNGCGEISVWLNRDLSKNYPQDYEIEPQFNSPAQAECDMVQQIIDLVIRNTDESQQPSPSLEQFFRHKSSAKVTKRYVTQYSDINFAKALLWLQEYAHQHCKGGIPNKFASVLQIYNNENLQGHEQDNILEPKSRSLNKTDSNVDSSVDNYIINSQKHNEFTRYNRASQENRLRTSKKYLDPNNYQHVSYQNGGHQLSHLSQSSISYHRKSSDNVFQYPINQSVTQPKVNRIIVPTVNPMRWPPNQQYHVQNNQFKGQYMSMGLPKYFELNKESTKIVHHSSIHDSSTNSCRVGTLTQLPFAQSHRQILPTFGLISDRDNSKTTQRLKTEGDEHEQQYVGTLNNYSPVKNVESNGLCPFPYYKATDQPYTTDYHQIRNSSGTILETRNPSKKNFPLCHQLDERKRRINAHMRPQNQILPSINETSHEQISQVYENHRNSSLKNYSYNIDGTNNPRNNKKNPHSPPLKETRSAYNTITDEIELDPQIVADLKFYQTQLNEDGFNF